MSAKTLTLAALLAFAASLASADPLQFTFGPTPVAANDGSSALVQYSFTVTATAAYSGILTTSTAASAADEFSQLSLVLSSGGTTITIPGSQLVLASSASEQATGMFGLPYTAYTNTYTFDPYLLATGDWTATLWGLDVDGSKSADTVSLTLNDPPNNVPEPQSLALAAVALAALGAASRRRRHSL